MLFENDQLRIDFYPELGGKITSFYHKEKNFELAAQSTRPLKVLPPTSEGFAPYAFGMDDAFPNIDAEQIDWGGRTLTYPDHGEIWMADFSVVNQSENSVSLSWKSPNLHYRYEKTLQLIKNMLHIRYRITNEGNDKLPCFWTWHGLMRYEEDIEVILPKGTTHCRNVLDSPILGEPGAVYSVKNGSYDFTKIPGAQSKTMSKFYAEHPVKEGRCGLRYPSQNVTCMIEYDPEKLPYWGFWITAGGFQNDYNCALEPTNGFYDSISIAWKYRKLPILLVGSQMIFDVKISLD